MKPDTSDSSLDPKIAIIFILIKFMLDIVTICQFCSDFFCSPIHIKIKEYIVSMFYVKAFQ